MRPLQTDFSIYKKFNFERPAVGFKFMFHKPEGIEQLDKELSLCEMLKEGQQRETPFYFTKENENCFGKSFLGMVSGGGPSDGGLLGVKFEIMQEAHANLRLRRFVTNIEPGAVNYVAVSPLEKLTFEPDLIILTANPGQAEIALRAMTYSTGELFESKSTLVGGCAWVYVYPHISQKVNYTVTGLAYGMKGRQVFPEGLILISIPHNWIQTITRNLNEMKWDIQAYKLGREKFIQYEQQLRKNLAQEAQNP
jgi:uncharacterized protein (DUF169 family)